MCLIIHQPAGLRTPLALLRSAAEYNPDGYGFMGMDARGKPRIERGLEIDLAKIADLAERFAGLECAWHFRRRTRGAARADNLHPFKLGDGLYLMHNGTANVPLRVAGQSDTWHLVNDYLAPLLAHRRKLIYDRAFLRILEQWLGRDNRLVFFDERDGRIELPHRAEGLEWRGLWLSNARWVDRRLLGLDDEKTGVYRVDEVGFC